MRFKYKNKLITDIFEKCPFLMLSVMLFILIPEKNCASLIRKFKIWIFILFLLIFEGFMLVYIFLYVCTHLCAGVCMYVEASGQYWGSSLIAFHFNFWGKVLYWNWSLEIWLDWLASKPQVSSYLYLPSAGITGACSCTWLCMWMLGIQTQAHILRLQTPHHLSHLPTLLEAFWVLIGHNISE